MHYKLLKIVNIISMLIGSTGVSYALRPASFKNSSAHLKAALVSYGKSGKEELTLSEITGLLKSASPLSEERPPVEDIKNSRGRIMESEKMFIETMITDKLFKNFSIRFWRVFRDRPKNRFIPIKKIPADKMDGLAAIIEGEDDKQAILVNEDIFSMYYGAYISLVGAGAYLKERDFGYRGHIFSVFHQVLAYLSLNRVEKEALDSEIGALKNKDKANFDEFIDFAKKVSEKVTGKDCGYLYSAEFIGSVFSFVEKHYPYSKTEETASLKTIRKKISLLVKEYRIGRWILRDISNEATRFERPKLTQDEKERIFKQVNKALRLEWLTKTDMLDILSRWGIYGGSGEEAIRYIVKNNPDYFDSKFIETLAASMAGSDNAYLRFVSGMQLIKELAYGIPRDKYMDTQQKEDDLEKQEILQDENAHFVAAGIIKTIAEIYPQHITQRAFNWLIISLEIYIKEASGSFMRDDAVYYDASFILEALKNKSPKLYAKLLVCSKIADKELGFLINGYKQTKEDATYDYEVYDEDDGAVGSVDDKYIDIETVSEIAGLALSSKMKESAITLLRRIVNLKPVFMLKLFDRVGAKIYDLFDELKDIPVENFESLQENKKRWGLNNDFIALCAGNKPVDEDILQLDVLFEEESPFICIKITKRLFSPDSDWRFDDVKELYRIDLFSATWNFHAVYIDKILALNAKERKKVFAVLKEAATREELYWISELFAGNITTALIEHSDNIMSTEDDVLRERLSRLRELMREGADLVASLYIRLLLAEDSETFIRLYSSVLLSAGIKVELRVSDDLRKKIERFREAFEDTEPALSKKKTAGDAFYFIPQMFDLCDADILAKLDKEEIKKRYRRLAKAYHTDKGGTDRTFLMLNEAYKILNYFVSENGKASIEYLTREPAALEAGLSPNIIKEDSSLTAISQSA